MDYPTTPQSTMGQPIEMAPEPKSNLLKWILVSLVIIAVICGLVYYFLFYKKTNTQSTTQNSSQNADWKLYTNNEAKFSMEYPAAWNVDDKSDKGSLTSGPPKSILFIGEEGLVQIFYGTSFGGVCPQGSEKMTIGGEEFNVCHMAKDDVESWLVSGKKFGTFTLGMFASANKPATTNREVILKVLSTFKFIK